MSDPELSAGRRTGAAWRLLRRSALPAVLVCSLLGTSAGAFAGSNDQPVMVTVKRMSLKTALRVAQAAVAECRDKGIQIGVTVLDRSGQAQVVLRDVLAPDLTLEVSRQKAYTAMSFNTPTSALGKRFKNLMSVAKVDGILPAAGGLPITAAGSIIGGVGVSGAPSGMTDEACAQAGIDAVSFDLQMSDTQ